MTRAPLLPSVHVHRSRHARFSDIKTAKRTQARNPEKRQAHITLNNALKSGLVRGYCDVCQRAVRLQAHHEDYAKPLWVAWVCTTCHRNIQRASLLSAFNCEQRHDGYPGSKSARNPTRGSYGQKLLTINVEVVEHQGKRAHKFPQVTLPFARSLALAIVEMGNRREH